MAREMVNHLTKSLPGSEAPKAISMAEPSLANLGAITRLWNLLLHDSSIK